MTKGLRSACFVGVLQVIIMGGRGARVYNCVLGLNYASEIAPCL